MRAAGLKIMHRKKFSKNVKSSLRMPIIKPKQRLLCRKKNCSNNYIKSILPKRESCGNKQLLKKYGRILRRMKIRNYLWNSILCVNCGIL